MPLPVIVEILLLRGFIGATRREVFHIAKDTIRGVGSRFPDKTKAKAQDVDRGIAGRLVDEMRAHVPVDSGDTSER